ncbi:putative polyamine transporter [Sesamum angolense]|uniref:Polyamine transporter n=1 Tax=Sesamum angolense TaxID=2727404 RepID=A0AAE1WZ13_9LAMI|nr:putative polyamine transporter [Sesamum angolense]
MGEEGMENDSKNAGSAKGNSVRAGGGPLLSLLGFLIFPFFWSIPEALVTAELATFFPANGGYVLWISSAFGPFWGFQEGFWRWFSGVMDNALYPVLFLDYLKHSFPILDNTIARIPALLGITLSLTYLNYRGLHIVGFSAILLACFSLLPFAVMAVISIPRIRPRRWLVVDYGKVEWRGYFNSLFWNLNYWDNASTLAGEVENPSRTFPRALLGAVVLVVCSYLVPLLVGTGAVETDSGEWSAGYFAQIGMLIGGSWLKWWIQAASALSNMGMFEAEMSSDAYQLGISKYGTPTFSILCSASGVIFLSWMSFQEILEFLNFLYAVGMLLEFAAFIKLRIKRPDLHRPYKIPLETFGATILCLPPVSLLILVMCLASPKTYLVSGAVIILGFALYPALIHAKNQKWIDFSTDVTLRSSDDDLEGHPMVSEEHQADTDEASHRLLSDLPSSTTSHASHISPMEAGKLE